MFKKIKLFNKLCKIIEAIEAFYNGNKEKIEKAKEYIPQIKKFILEAEEILKKLQNKVEE